jgi:peptidoglycan/LPS O-acetylase OafA/YrhL
MNNRIVFLDWLRIIACTIVFLTHIYPKFFMKDLGIIYGGNAGVTLFFIISGYIIPFALEKVQSYRIFFIRRFFRIFPLFFICAIWVLLKAGIANFNFTTFLIQITLLLGPILDTPFVIGGADWTLRVEEWLYIILAFLFFKNKLNVKYILSVGLLIFLYGILKYFYSGFKITQISLLYFPTCLIGTVIFLYEKGSISKKELQISIATLFLLVVIAHFISIYSLKRVVPLSPFVGLAIFLISYKYRHLFIQNKIITTLSSLTYSAYLFHSIVFPLIVTHLFFCYALHKFIEKPLIKYSKEIR